MVTHVRQEFPWAEETYEKLHKGLLPRMGSERLMTAWVTRGSPSLRAEVSRQRIAVAVNIGHGLLLRTCSTKLLPEIWY